MFQNFSDKDGMKQAILKKDDVKEKLIVHDVTQFEAASLDPTKFKERNLDAKAGRYYAQYYKNNKSKLSTNLAEANTKYMDYLPLNIQLNEVKRDFIRTNKGSIVHSVVLLETGEEHNVYVVTFSDSSKFLFNKKKYTVQGEGKDPMYTKFFFNKNEDNLTIALDYTKQKLNEEAIRKVVKEAKGVMLSQKDEIEMTNDVVETKDLTFKDLLRVYFIMKNKQINWDTPVKEIVEANFDFLNKSVFNGLRRSKTKKATESFWVDIINDDDMFNSMYREFEDLRHYWINVKLWPKNASIDFPWFKAYMVTNVDTSKMEIHTLLDTNHHVVKGWDELRNVCFVFIEY